MEMLHKRKSHLYLHIKLKLRLPKDNIFPSEYPIVQIPGADVFLNDFVGLCTKNPVFKGIVSLCLLREVVAKMSGNSAPKFPMLAYNFYLGINCTSRKAFESVSINLAEPALRKFQKRDIFNDSRSNTFVDYIKQMVKYSIICFIK